MVITPGISDLPFTCENGYKVFELTAEEICWELVDGIFIRAWGYNGSTPGPTIHVFPGDRVIFRVYNHLPVRTSVHWHGLEVPNVMDGVPPQDNAGLLGGLIVEDPCMQHRQGYRDYLCLLQEWAVDALPWGDLTPGTYELNFVKPRFNFFTINGRCYPRTLPLEIRWGDTVRVRFGNIQMHHHPIHLHGHQFQVVGADGFPIQPTAKICKNTILVASGETWDVEFKANNRGIWPMHCHMPHHVTNNGDPAVGGMFTTVNYI